MLDLEQFLGCGVCRAAKPSVYRPVFFGKQYADLTMLCKRVVWIVRDRAGVSAVLSIVVYAGSDGSDFSFSADKSSSQKISEHSIVFGDGAQYFTGFLLGKSGARLVSDWGGCRSKRGYAYDV